MILTPEPVEYDSRHTSVKRGDLKPDLVYYAWDAHPDPAKRADLSQVVSWRLIAVGSDGYTFSASTENGTLVASDPDDEGRVTLTHQWLIPETAVERRYIVEGEAMWPGSKPQSFPRIVVDIEPDLG